MRSNYYCSAACLPLIMRISCVIPENNWGEKINRFRYIRYISSYEEHYRAENWKILIRSLHIFHWDINPYRKRAKIFFLMRKVIVLLPVLSSVPREFALSFLFFIIIGMNSWEDSFRFAVWKVPLHYHRYTSLSRHRVHSAGTSFKGTTKSRLPVRQPHSNVEIEEKILSWVLRALSMRFYGIFWKILTQSFVLALLVQVNIRNRKPHKDSLNLQIRSRNSFARKESYIRN
jgi:hypothetical protein